MTAGIGHGSQFQRSDNGTSGGAFASVGTVYDIRPPGLSRETVDVTSHASTERWREFIGGLRDGGEMAVDIEFDPSAQAVADFLADLNADAAGYYKIIFPNTTEWAFAGLMNGFEATDPLDDKLMATATFKITGKPGFIA